MSTMSTMDKLKMVYGFLLLVVLGALAAMFGLAKVEQATSFGLQDILGGLLVLTGGFANWCFRVSSKEDEGRSA